MNSLKLQLKELGPIGIEDRVAFDMYFGGLCSFQMHPGSGTKDHTNKSLSECRDIALAMLVLRKQTFGDM